MKIVIRPATSVAAAAVLGVVGLAGPARAACPEGAVTQCTLNGQSGTRECVSGQWTPCLVENPLPALATPTVTSRTANTLTVRWSSGTDPGEQYQLQHFSGGAWLALAALSSPATFVHTGLQPDAKYCYRVRASGPHGTRTSSSNCRYTTDGTGRQAWRVRAEFQTGNVSDAGTDDSVAVLLTEAGGNRTWVDYGRDDFERGDTFAYDLGLDRVDLISDINRIRIEKTGTDGWCVAALRLLVNDRLAYSESFQSLPGGCRWIGGDDGHQPWYEVGHSKLRANPAWQSYVEPQRIELDISAFPRITATLRVPRDEAESRIEGMIGNVIHGTELHWGDRHGDRYVEATWTGYTGRVNVDLDLEKSSWWFDPEVDIDFDLHYEPKCSADQTEAIVDVTTRNLQVNVDYDWFAEVLSFVLPCGPIATPIANRPIPNCIEALERYIEDRIRGAFRPIVQSQRQSLPQGYRCLSAAVQVDDAANVDLIFHIEAPPPARRQLPILPRP